MKRSLIVFGAVCLMCAAAMFTWLSGSGSWDPSRIPSPWSDGTPIYEHVKTHLDPTGGLLAGGEELGRRTQSTELSNHDRKLLERWIRWGHEVAHNRDPLIRPILDLLETTHPGIRNEHRPHER